MIQRIQTVYMFLGVLVTAAIFLVPIASFGTADGEMFQYKLMNFDSVFDLGLKQQQLITPVITNWLTGLLLLVNIFLYKNRKLQKRILMIIVVINLATLGSSFYVADQIERLSTIASQATYQIGIYLPLVNMVLLVLANNAIRKDDKLVKSADRLR
ncbi:MAG: DUF4293 domain-containing protein [Bacteroidales bacterium]|nr:DUF4293 domain-containing protein [Bacteroidales bacterium]MCF8327696.1 DUF4293 domain-containing protein [Bacteroidales bacterium]